KKKKNQKKGCFSEKKRGVLGRKTEANDRTAVGWENARKRGADGNVNVSKGNCRGGSGQQL
ncbi:hypothetical protein, partial [Escherichia coli]|uniref:hypothetical protein n=1 Tax=Escherichia coli TaxID=562 RepID=UPI001BAF2F7C